MSGNTDAPYDASQPALVSLSEALKHVRISRDTAYRLIASDTFPLPLIMVGQRWFVRTADINALIKRPSCQDHLGAPPGVSPGLWDYVHHMAHARVPFTLVAFTAIANCSTEKARRAVEIGVDREWFKMAAPLDGVRRWVGTL
jgi:predicted DNA-binding transcriptional regulator AlpA